MARVTVSLYLDELREVRVPNTVYCQGEPAVRSYIEERLGDL